MFIESSRWQEAEQRANQLTERLNISASEGRTVDHGFEQLRHRISNQDKHIEDVISHVGRLSEASGAQDLRSDQGAGQGPIEQSDLSVSSTHAAHGQVAVLQGRDLPLTSDEVRFRDVVESHHASERSD